MLKSKILLWSIRILAFVVAYALGVWIVSAYNGGALHSRPMFYACFIFAIFVASVVGKPLANKINIEAEKKRKEFEIKAERNRVSYAQLLKEPEAMFNSKACRHCGKLHKVELYPEADGYAFPIYENDDACKAFRRDVSEAIKKINDDWRNRDAIWKGVAGKIPCRKS